MFHSSGEFSALFVVKVASGSAAPELLKFVA